MLQTPVSRQFWDPCIIFFTSKTTKPTAQMILVDRPKNKMSKIV